MNILAIDIGNSRITFGLFRSSRLASVVHLARKSSSQRDIWRVLRQFLNGRSPSGVVISSVVPEATKSVKAVIRTRLDLDPLIISGMTDTGLRISYKNPARLGADRVCGAAAAFEKYGGPVIVVDAGTATTFDVVSKDGTFLGGAIAPGISTAAASLHSGTARLPQVALRFPDSVIGRDTKECIQSGILFGTVAAIEGVVHRIKVITGRQTTLVLTGGFSSLLKAKTDIFDAVEPALVLEGARLIYTRIRGKGHK